MGRRANALQYGLLGPCVGIEAGMQIIRALTGIASKIDSQFVVIGGHAINAHGYSRSTGDLDLAIPRKDGPRWRTEILALDYEILFEQPAFIQFKAKRIDAWPIDLMLVDDATFEKMQADASSFLFRDSTALIASVPHLIAMKLHTLSKRPEHREEKDLADLRELLKMSNLSAGSELFLSLCRKYDSMWVYERLGESKG